MAIDDTLIKQLHDLNNFVHENSAQYYHSRPLAFSEANILTPDKSRHVVNITYDLKDWLLIGAVTESPVLLTGGTDAGKTTLAKLVMNGLLGSEEEGWHKLDFDNDFGKDAYTDVSSDFFQESGKNLSDLYSLHGWLTLPGFIADELNRAHPKIVQKALHLIKEKDITLPDGRRAKVGHDIGNNSTYQFQIATINEGAEYSGVYDIDKAMRRRTTIEIPMDIFPASEEDRERIQNSDEEIELKNKTSNLETLLKIHASVKRDLKLHPLAKLFVSYLEAFDYCKHSITGEKGGVSSTNGSLSHICTQPIRIAGRNMGNEGMSCEFMKSFENDLCAYVRGITPGISKNLISVAKGVAALRATKFVEVLAYFAEGINEIPLKFSITSPDLFKISLQKYTGTVYEGIDLSRAAAKKYISDLEVTREDIEAAIGFVGYSKVGIAQNFVKKHFQGNMYEAVTSFSRVAKSKFIEGIAHPSLSNWKLVLSGRASVDDLKNIKQYCGAENPWLWKTLTPYVTKKLATLDHEKVQGIYQ